MIHPDAFLRAAFLGRANERNLRCETPRLCADLPTSQPLLLAPQVGRQNASRDDDKRLEFREITKIHVAIRFEIEGSPAPVGCKRLGRRGHRPWRSHAYGEDREVVETDLAVVVIVAIREDHG